MRAGRADAGTGGLDIAPLDVGSSVADVARLAEERGFESLLFNEEEVGGIPTS